MAVADDVAGWLQANAAPSGATVHAHRQPTSFGVTDVLVVEQERERGSHLFGGGRGYREGGETELRIALWWIVNARRPEAQRSPQRALDGLTPVLDALTRVRRQTIGSMLVRHVSDSLGPMLRSTEIEDQIVAWGRVTLSVHRAP